MKKPTAVPTSSFDYHHTITEGVRVAAQHRYVHAIGRLLQPASYCPGSAVFDIHSLLPIRSRYMCQRLCGLVVRLLGRHHPRPDEYQPQSARSVLECQSELPRSPAPIFGSQAILLRPHHASLTSSRIRSARLRSYLPIVSICACRDH
jgi:hypothetical protein